MNFYKISFAWVAVLALLIGLSACQDSTKPQNKPAPSKTSNAPSTAQKPATAAEESLASHKPKQIKGLELPRTTSQDVVIKHTGFTLSYNEQHEQANWVAYQLTAEETDGTEPRYNRFMPDPKVPTGSAVDADYRGSGYDRGHLAPAADMKWSEDAMRESFYFSNMSPQTPGLNRGIWKSLEEQVRRWAAEHGVVYVVTGGVLESGLPTIGKNEVSVPRYYYKVLLDYRAPGLRGIGFIMPNEGADEPLESFAVSIDSVERLTGLDFFHLLPDPIEQQLESSFDFSAW